MNKTPAGHDRPRPHANGNRAAGTTTGIGDQLLAEPKRVEEVFARLGRVLHLHVAGQVIRTTAEHPF
jgi:hypothetical protein